MLVRRKCELLWGKGGPREMEKEQNTVETLILTNVLHFPHVASLYIGLRISELFINS